jgi:hypothetical protein
LIDESKLPEDVRTFRELERQDPKDARTGRATLAGDFGESFGTYLSAVNEYLDELAPDERDKIESATDATGSLLLNDPGHIKLLLDLAIGDVPTERGEIDREIEKLKSQMRLDLHGWHRNPTARARLQALYQARNQND